MHPYKNLAGVWIVKRGCPYQHLKFEAQLACLSGEKIYNLDTIFFKGVGKHGRTAVSM